MAVGTGADKEAGVSTSSISPAATAAICGYNGMQLWELGEPMEIVAAREPAEATGDALWTSWAFSEVQVCMFFLS